MEPFIRRTDARFSLAFSQIKLNCRIESHYVFCFHYFLLRDPECLKLQTVFLTLRSLHDWVINRPALTALVTAYVINEMSFKQRTVVTW